MNKTHPRPQLVREEWTDLCGEWGFAYDDDDRGVGERWFDVTSAAAGEAFGRTILVPYPPESKLSGINDKSFHPVVWYRRTFEAPSLPAGGRLLLHFGAVDYVATVWVNGRLLGSHTGGQTPFSFDVTGALTDGPQTVVVRAEDRPADVSQPRGKQDWRTEPHGIFYDRTTGIWQPVWLEPVAQNHVTTLHWTPDLPASRVSAELRLDRVPERPVTVEVRLRKGEEELAREQVTVADQVAYFDVAVPALRHQMTRPQYLWSPESPTLIDVDVTVRDADGQQLDRFGSYLGLRSAGFRDGRFLLNGHPYYLRMVLEQGYWPESHLAAPDADALRREVELIKSLGFNAARIHQKVEDPRFLYWCDRLGLLIWGEMANAFEFSSRAIERLVPEWLEVIRRDRSHPCIVTWVPLNESWGVPDMVTEADRQHYASGLYHLTKALDPSRPVISNDGWELTETDIVGVHDYSPVGESLHKRWGTPEAVQQMLHGSGPGRKKVLLGGADNPAYAHGQPVVITEFGGLSYAPEAGQKWFGYGTVTSAEEFLDNFREIVTALLDSTEVAGFCYTQLTDTLQERNGLLDEHRNPKLPVEAIREVLTRYSNAIPAEVVDVSRRAARKASLSE